MSQETLFSGQLHPLSSCVAALAFLNNIVLFSSPWILGGTESPWGKKFSADYPIQASILYAISQPVYLIIFLWLGASPWVLLLALSSLHLMSTETSRVMSPQSSSQPVDNEKLSDKYEASTSDDLVGLSYDASKSAGNRTAAMLALPIQTSAALDAAFLLLAADLTRNPESHMSSTAEYALPLVGFVAYFSARLGDVRLAQYTHRKGLFHAFTSPLGKRPAAILSCLVCLLIVRTGLGWILGRLTGWPLLQLLLLSPSEAPVVFDNGRLEFVVEYAANYSENLIPILSCAQIPIYVAGYYLLRRAERHNTS